MNTQELRKEGVDLRLVLLLLLKKSVTILVGTLVGALIGAIIYMSIYMAAVGGAKYKCEEKFYIHFDQIEQEDYFDYYYNGACWDELLSSDLILGKAMQLLHAPYEREFVDSCITADILADVRVVTVSIEAPLQIEAAQIKAAIREAMIQFAEFGEFIVSIEMISDTEPQLEVFDNNVWRAILLGAVLGLIFSVIGCLILIGYDADIYVASQFEKRYHVPCAGIMLKGEEEDELMKYLAGEHLGRDEDPMGLHRKLQINLDHLMKSGNVNAVSIDELEESEEIIYKKLRPLDGIVLLCPQGKGNGRKLDMAMHTLAVQDVKVLALVLTKAPRGFIRSYYFARSESKPNANEE